MIDLRRLRYFVVCAEELHFTRAAKRIGIAQPPLSQQIKHLEFELGTKLFERTTRGMELTSAGLSLLGDARNVIAAAEQAYSNAQRIGRGEGGSLRLGFTGSVALNSIVPNAVAAFRKSFPAVDIKLYENTTSMCLRSIREGNLDLALIRPAPYECEALYSRAIVNERMFLAVPTSHVLAEQVSVDVARLKDEDFVLYPRTNGPALYDLVVGSCEQQGFSPKIVQEAPQMVSTVSLVAAGIGVTFVPESMKQLHASGVRYIPLRAPELVASIHLVRRERPVPSVIVNFTKTIKGLID